MSNKLAERPAGRKHRAKARPVGLKKPKPTSNLVDLYVRGPSGKAMAVECKQANVIGCIQAGLGFHEMDALRASLDVPMQTLAAWLGISKATLQRRKAKGRLDPAESDRLLRFARLMGMAVTVMETPQNARRWLNSPQRGLGGAVPLDYAETEIGAREVEDLLGRIEFGVYS
jgi:putative toxin-antitoxin system antitoxin component (TIGR02293 family)